MAEADKAAWEQLGEMLERHRVLLDVRYANLTTFTAERHVDYRLAWDIEHGARSNYRRATLTAIELAYGWEPGSIERVLAGGQPIPRGEVHAPQYEDPDEQAVADKAWNDNAALADDQALRRMFSDLAVRMYRRHGNGGAKRRHA